MQYQKKGIEIPCVVCGFLKYIKPSQIELRKSIKTYCSKICQSIDYKTRFAGKNNPAYGQIYRTKISDPDWAQNISKGLIRNKVNVGDKNGMKDPEVAKRMSKTRRERVTSNPEYRKARSNDMRKAWADGKYEGVKVGKCKWYQHIKPNGEIVKLQGTWEVVYAKYLDCNKITYDAHKGRIVYVDDKGDERSYYPDFYLHEDATYIDVKGALFYENYVKKIDMIKKSNPNLKFDVITKESFSNMGINLQKETKKINQPSVGSHVCV